MVLFQDQKNVISIQILFIEIKEFLYHIKMDMKIFLVIKLLKTVKFVMMIILMVLMIGFHVNMISNLIDKYVQMDNSFYIICSVNMESLMMVTTYHTMEVMNANILELKIAIIISKLFITVCTLLSKMCISDYRAIIQIQIQNYNQFIQKNVKGKLIYIQIDRFQYQSG
ncbi:unnamed protein product [Paramecium sonneborni]|uniref:Transmembrane protein n=1 Tax=Paramecium sonneborni TaxID=65129 RepID=A0A8S1RTC3_9CILI|nr:unnamed protein product [Paramecium sonneborni]